MAYHSDSESDTFSLLDVPRPSAQALMQQAMSEGRLPNLVLEGRASLSPSIALCLEVLGIGTSGPQRQRSAALSLVGLCTHRKLRPAVDNQLVIRRLCRIIELTDCAEALAAAAAALFKVADDEAWQAKGGATEQILREALVRCVNNITAVAKASTRADGQVKSAPGAADGEQAVKGAVGDRKADAGQGRRASAEEDLAAAAAAAAVEEDPDQRAALAAAAAAVLQGPALHLLSPSQLQQAAGSLAAVIAGGLGGPEVLSALSTVVRHGPGAEDRAAAAAAVVQFPGAVAALLDALDVGGSAQLGGRSAATAPGTQSSGPQTGGGDGDAPDSPGDADETSKAPAARADDDGRSDGRAAGEQPPEAARGAFSCLSDVVESCVAGASECHVVGLHPRHVRPLLRVIQSGHPEDAKRALRCLLVLTSLTHRVADGSESTVYTVDAVESEIQRQPGAASALLRAAQSLLGDAGATDFPDGATAEMLCFFATDLRLERAITMEQLLRQAPALTAAAVGVLAGKQPGADWGGLFASVAKQDGDVTRYPGRLVLAAAELAYYVLHWATRQSEAVQRASWLSAAEVADGLIPQLLMGAGGGAGGAAKLFGELDEWGVRCLTLGLQLAPPADRWAKYGISDLKAIVNTLAGSVKDSSGGAKGQQAAGQPGQEHGTKHEPKEKPAKEELQKEKQPKEKQPKKQQQQQQQLLKPYEAAELAAVVTLSLWSRVAPTDASSDMQELIRGLLQLATAALQCAAAVADDPTDTLSRPHRAAILGGVLNCIIGCLQPQRAITGPASQPLIPILPSFLLSQLAADVGRLGSAPLLKLYYNFRGKTYGKPRSEPPEVDLQVQWAFEAPPQPDSWDAAFRRHYDLRSGSYTSTAFGTGYTTVAATTAQPLLRAMGHAAARLSELAEELLLEVEALREKGAVGSADRAANGAEDGAGSGASREGVSEANGQSGAEANGQSGAEAAEPAPIKTSRLARSALRVAGNTAAVLALCAPCDK